jgi:hypothetical protein
MVKPPFRRVYAEAELANHCPAYPQRARRETHIWLMSCAQIATIPMNNVSDASAAASSTKILSINTSCTLEHRQNIVLFLFYGQGAKIDRFKKAAWKNIAWLIGAS